MRSRKWLFGSLSLAILLCMALCTAALAEVTGEARAKQSAANLRAIGQWIVMYATENRGFLPPDLTYLPAKSREPEARKIFADPGAPVDQLKKLEEMSDEDFNKWLLTQGHYKFLYEVDTAIKIHTLRKPAQTPIAIERKVADDGKIVILFADGHVETFMSVPAGKPGGPTTRPQE